LARPQRQVGPPTSWMPFGGRSDLRLAGYY